MSVAEAQAYQTIPPTWAARAVLMHAESQCLAIVNDRIWPADLPGKNVFDNTLPGVVITEAGGAPDPRANTVYIEGSLVLRIFGGSNKLSDVWAAWHFVRQSLLLGGGREVTVDKIDCNVRWLWAKEINPPTEIRKHPITQWPELNCTVQYALQGI